LPGLFHSLTGRRRRLADARALLGAAVRQARSPLFFVQGGAADTPEGRFALQALHVLLLVRRLRREPAEASLAQTVVDLFVADLDAALREMGVGDLAVPRQMKFLAKSFFAAAPRLDAALAGTAEFAPVFDALPGLDGPAFDAAGLARYLAESDRVLSRIPREALSGSAGVWPESLA
jgi:cytochrome b pre-mRNA-processing protein 3